MFECEIFNLLRELFVREMFQTSAASPSQTSPTREDNEEEATMVHEMTH